MRALANVLRTWFAVVATTAGLAAQERLEVAGPEPSVLRLGDSARVDVRIHDPQGSLRDLAVPKVDGLVVRVFGPSRQEQVQIANGRRVHSVQVVYQLELQPQREGRFEVPSFPVWTGSREQATSAIRLEATKDLRGEQFAWLDVVPEKTRVYVHEPVRLHVEFGVQNGVRLARGRAQTGQVYQDVEVQAPWLDQMPYAEKIDLPEPIGATTLIVHGGNRLVVVGHDPVFERDGASWQRFKIERAYVPTQPGRIELVEPTLRFQVVRNESRDVFGLSRGGVAENFFVYGKPLSIEVLPIPDVGRPNPYYGAVGRFTLEATLDRDQVKVGNSVKLTLTVRGQGNLEFLRLPTLDDLPGLHKLGQTEVQRSAERVAVTYDLTPLRDTVTQVPAIEWNFFDTTPGVERFVAVRTPPLSLQVTPLPPGETLAAEPENVAAAVTPGVDDVFDLPDLRGPAVQRELGSALGNWAAVLGPWLLLLTGLLCGRFWSARRADVVGGRARRAMRAALAQLDAGADPALVLADYLGARLGVPGAALIAADAAARLEAAGVAPELAQRTAVAIDSGTAARYGGGASLSVDTVRGLLRDLEGARFGVVRVLPWLLLPLCGALASGGGLTAQQPADPAVAAYRAKDWAAAEAGFARAFAATGDRRLLRARGNCFVRMEPPDLPRALWAYESARLGLPRDEELLANLRLVQQRLELPAEDDGLFAQVARLLRRFTTTELQLACAGLMTLAAAALLFGWRRSWLRWLGGLLLVHAVAIAAELLWLAPARPMRAIALQRLELAAEPRADLPALATVRPGVTVTVLGSAVGSFVRVQAGDRIGYVPTASVGVID